MDITPYVEGLRRDLVAAAESGTPEVRAAADRLAATLDPAARLALMEALSHAAAEITRELPAGAVDVRLQGRELEFVVTAPAAPSTTAGPSAPPAVVAAGQSLNTWLVGVVRRATSETIVDVDLDLSSIPFLPDPFGRPHGGRGGQKGNGRRMTGWV